ncbi:MAG: MBL fold metallo-hydrolase [Cyanobacteria bacterium P01_F01_bin.150]
MHYTYYGANSWLLELGGQRILIDPWLVESLVFANSPWLFKGDRAQPLESLPENIDLIVLSQGLEDHAHQPTLEKLDKTIPVVASPAAVKVVKSLGYFNVTSLAPGEFITIVDSLMIQALSGAPIGLQVENGYLITDIKTQYRVYYEPHGFPPANLDKIDAVNTVISPVVNLALPLAGAIIKGNETALKLAKQLTPQLFLPTAVGGDVSYSGFLDSLLSQEGSVEEFRATLARHNLDTQVVQPPVNQCCDAINMSIAVS